MRIGTIILEASVCLALTVPVLAQGPPPQGAGMTMKNFKVDAFVKQVDTDKDGSMTKEEWKAAGLIDMPFTMCDTSKDNKIT